ncbi:unnamed protein product [Clonostachys rhizophaga]|uniref:Nephrocystin 3-like N-terminal domain-containing protein n=1 Tax=Clonostachys rhizophaga TaxID=160324 RepID=A0A9N9YQA2_9HYPO|nr:unnamed protein product [Clonostachys rhizophaga]
MSNTHKHTETSAKALVQIDPSAPGTIVRVAFAAESVINLFLATRMIFNPKQAFEQMYLTDGKSAAPHAASVLQLFGLNLVAMTVPMVLALPNKPGAIELKRTSYQMIAAFEALALPITLWQAWIAGEEASGLNPNKLIWGFALPMGALLGFRAWVFFIEVRAEAEILACLHPFGSEYEVPKDRNPERIAGTCEWFINHERFQHWQGTECSSLLWVSADPGCGKSVLAKYLVDSLFSGSNSTTCFFFFKDALQGQSEVTDALRCLLYQIFHQQPTLLSNDVALCRDLDALDECEERGRIQLLEALNKLYNTESPKFSLKILVTSRPYALIHQELQTLEERHPTIHLSGEDQVEQISREIDISIRARLKDITRIHRLTEEEESTLMDELTKPQNRTYLWVHLMFEELKRATILTKRDLITCAHNLPKTVEEEYNLILDRSKGIEKTKKILHIIVAAQRAMSLQDYITLYHQPHQGLQPHQSPRSHQELQPLDAQRIKQNIREACGLFVVIKDSKVYLLHQTAREFLVKPLSSAPVDDNQPWHHYLCPMDSNRILAEICIWYLLLVDFQKIYMTPDFEQANDQYPLLHYASSNWVVHFQQIRMKRCDRLISSALKLCSPFQKGNPIWFEIYWKENQQKKGRRVPPSGFDALMMASYFGLERVVEELLAVKSPLSNALVYGYPEIAGQLIKKGAKIEVKDNYQRTPLALAARWGYRDITQLLLEKGADIKTRDKDQMTPLALAAAYGYIGQNTDTIQLLLEKGADIKARDKDQMTPLEVATALGHRDMIQLLLDKGI